MKAPGSPRQSWEGAGLQSEVCPHARHLRVLPGVRRFLLLKSQGATCTQVPNAAPAGVRLCPDTRRTRCSHRHMRDTRAHRHAHGHMLRHACSLTRRHTQTHASSGEDAHGPCFSFVPASPPGALLSVSLVKGFHRIHRPLSSELPGRLVTFLPAALLRGLPTPLPFRREGRAPPHPDPRRWHWGAGREGVS